MVKKTKFRVQFKNLWRVKRRKKKMIFQRKFCWMDTWYWFTRGIKKTLWESTNSILLLKAIGNSMLMKSNKTLFIRKLLKLKMKNCWRSFTAKILMKNLVLKGLIETYSIQQICKALLTKWSAVLESMLASLTMKIVKSMRVLVLSSRSQVLFQQKTKNSSFVATARTLILVHSR